MPVVTVSTDSSIPKHFDKPFVTFLSKALNKEMENIFLHVNDNHRVCIAGEPSDGPTYVIEIVAIGIFNPAANAEFTKSITDYFVSNLKAEASRTLIHFVDADPSVIGRWGKTIANLR